jgi:hypothetical protein
MHSKVSTGNQKPVPMKQVPVPCSKKLSKTECLYIATKFNDDVYAKLVLRWEELES